MSTRLRSRWRCSAIPKSSTSPWSAYPIAYGEKAVVAFVVHPPGRTPDSDALDLHCKNTLSAYKRPRSYRYVSELPRNAYGKVLKSELRNGFDADDHREE